MSYSDMEFAGQGSTSDSSSTTSAPMGLMCLPRELRDKVYEQYFLDMYYHGVMTVRLPDSERANSRPTTDIVFASWHTSEEAQEVMWKMLSPSIVEDYLHPKQISTVKSFLTQTRPEHKARIIKLRINWDEGIYDIPKDDTVAEIQARRLDIWGGSCPHESTWWNIDPAATDTHTPECDAAHAATLADLESEFPLITHMEKHILAGIRVLPTFNNLQTLKLHFPTPAQTSARRNPRSPWDTEGTLRFCFVEAPFFHTHFDELLEAVQGITSVRRLKLWGIEDLEMVEKLAVAMGVFEVVVEYSTYLKQPMHLEEMPVGWYLQARLGWGRGNKVRKWMRPFGEGVLVDKRVAPSKW